MRTLLSILVCAVPLVAAAQPGGEPPPSPVPAGAARATVLHVPVAEATTGQPIELVAAVDAAWAEPLLVVRYRGAGVAAWSEAAFRHSSTGGWYASVPAAVVAPPGVEYYLVGRGPAGEQLHFGSPQAPHLVRVEPSGDDRLAAIDAARTEGRTETVALDLDAHDFGNRYGNDDRFVRGELSWTHRVSGRLHALGFGFGFLEGKTPRVDPAQPSVTHSGRWGSAGARVRVMPWLYADARLILGVSHVGFMRGFGGTATFGRPWRSNLAFSGETLTDLGKTLAIRLQWDTVPPMLMGASIVRTDLPGTLISSAGLFIKYDVTYQLDRGVAVRAAVSYGSRDGAGKFGGGLGVAATF
ncbi:MAG: hypothetical protein R3B06_08610 [Kofleriaceae bacterium]